ncbi:MAG TPA: tRNA (guanine-N7)-methyltransferase [Polyangiaceae bacterium]|jgi:tRNA (guanine-N7-)-methyltransferase|nr:tRNA (guanine-N7)-methyltransferase [Polyangiaceae bacterium]
MERKPRPNHPYAHAARLPEGEAPVEIDSILPASGPVEIEIGGGKGGFVFERLAAAPEVRVLGFEIRLKLACTVDEKLAKLGLAGRGRVLAEDARRALPRLSPSGSVRAVFLHFPDPWWKKRHEKRLVMGDVVLAEIVRLLEPGGALFVQTDVEDRAALYRAQVATRPELVPSGDVAGDPTLAENPYGARSPREHRAIADGLPIHRMRWKRA